MTDDVTFLAQRVRDQERLLAAYRATGSRPPTGAITRLVDGRERWNTMRSELKGLK